MSTAFAERCEGATKPVCESPLDAVQMTIEALAYHILRLQKVVIPLLVYIICYECESGNTETRDIQRWENARDSDAIQIDRQRDDNANDSQGQHPNIIQ